MVDIIGVATTPIPTANDRIQAEDGLESPRRRCKLSSTWLVMISPGGERPRVAHPPGGGRGPLLLYAYLSSYRVNERV